jgi:dTDP-4-dehydrorhamnose reductase
MKKLIITGASGFLGWNICSLARSRYDVIGIGHTHDLKAEGLTVRCVDLTNANALDRLFHEIRPHAVIHAAAMSDPNFCERNPHVSEAINVEASARIAGLCARFGSRLAFTSSDLVFDGENPPYSELNETRPISVYGRQKVEAERAMLSVNPSALLCRMPLMFGDAPEGMRSFIQPMVASLLSGEPLGLFIDEYRTPVSARDAAIGILSMLETTAGVLHLGGKVSISRYDFGVLLGKSLGISNPALKRVFRKDIVMAAPRPKNVSLDSSKAFALGYDPESPEKALNRLQCLRTPKVISSRMVGKQPLLDELRG